MKLQTQGGKGQDHAQPRGGGGLKKHNGRFPLNKARKGTAARVLPTREAKGREIKKGTDRGERKKAEKLWLDRKVLFAGTVTL